MKEENELLKCPICFDLFHTALLLPCSHNFCALCIRQSLTFGHKRCPICKKASDTCDLRPNRLIDELVANYLGSQEIKKGFKGYTGEGVGGGKCKSNRNFQEFTISKPMCSTNENFSFSKVPNESCGRQSSKLSTSVKKPSPTKSRIEKSEPTATPGALISQADDEAKLKRKRIPPSLKTKTLKPNTIGNTKTCARNEKMSGKRKKVMPTQVRKKPKLTLAAMFSRSKAPEKVQCPVCKIPILKSKINTHLDQCLATSAGRESFHKVNQHLQWKLPASAPVRERYKAYSHMTTEEIKSLLRINHLPTQGDRKTLIKLHQEFVILQNASCDSLKPISGRQIARDMVLKRDRERMKLLFKRKPKAPTLEKKEQLFSDLLRKAKKRRKALRRKRKELNSGIPNEQVTSKQVIESYLPENRTVSNLPPYWEAVWNTKMGNVEYFNVQTRLKTTNRDLVYHGSSQHT